MLLETGSSRRARRRVLSVGIPSSSISPTMYSLALLQASPPSSMTCPSMTHACVVGHRATAYASTDDAHLQACGGREGGS
eukprot:scaffold34622_cov63-Phaeocystis_antarctica.AAC.5